MKAQLAVAYRVLEDVEDPWIANPAVVNRLTCGFHGMTYLEDLTVYLKRKSLGSNDQSSGPPAVLDLHSIGHGLDQVIFG